MTFSMEAAIIGFSFAVVTIGVIIDWFMERKKQ
jgi:hypothetical protein